MEEVTSQEEPAKEQDKRETRDHWNKWVKAAKRAAEKHWQLAKEAWAEYENAESDEGPRRSYPIYWSSCKTIEPAFYARTPVIQSEREFGIEDSVALTATTIADRLATYLTKRTDIGDVMQLEVLDFIHADKAAPQVLYSEDLEEVRNRVPLQPTEGGSFTDQVGQPWPGEVLQDAAGYFGESIENVPTNKRIDLAPLPYDEVLHTPDAKTESEIEEKAYYFCLTKEKALARFGDKLKGFTNWKKVKGGAEKEGRSERKDEQYGEEYLEGWEIFCKTTEKVYWFSEQFSDGLLDIKPDPYGLRGFFPSPAFIIANRSRKTLYPTPAHKQLKPLITQLHEQSEKVFSLIDGVRRRALVDGDEELIAALNADDDEYIICRNLQKLVEKGGLENVILWVPVQELVTAITELNALEEKFKNNFFEFFGVPDILRGSSDPVETATAQEVKVSAAHDRFRYAKKQVAKMVRDSIELMVDMALAKFDDVEIAQAVGFDYMTEEDKQRFPEALALLRDDKARLVRIEIDTDSLSFLDQQLKAQQVSQAAQTVTAGLREVAQMAQSTPDYAAAGLQTVMASLEAMPAGKQFQDATKKAFDALMEKVKNPPQQPPPPDYEKMKMELEQQKAGNTAQLQQYELGLKERELGLKERQMVVDAQLEQIKEGFNQQLETMLAQLEQQRVQIEGFQAQMQARESEMEEIRLAREADLKTYQEAVKTAQTTAPAEPTPPMIVNLPPIQTPPITIVNEASKAGKAEFAIERDELGQMKAIRKLEMPIGA